MGDRPEGDTMGRAVNIPIGPNASIPATHWRKAVCPPLSVALRTQGRVELSAEWGENRREMGGNGWHR